MSEKASPKESSTAKVSPKAALKDRWKSKVSVMASTKAEPTEAESLAMGSEKVRTMAETTEAEGPPKVSAKAQTKESLKAGLISTVTVKASQKQPL